jgi:uncharacterized YokU family protein
MSKNVICDWCNADASIDRGTVYWELPDGTRAIQITNTPTVVCPSCEMHYQTNELTKEIEDQLFLVDIKQIGSTINFEELMKLPRLLKRNYFDFSS